MDEYRSMLIRGKGFGHGFGSRMMDYNRKCAMTIWEPPKTYEGAEDQRMWDNGVFDGQGMADT